VLRTLWLDRGLILVAMSMQILVTEFGDETFIIAAIMAMRHPRLVVYVGAMSALVFMTVQSPVLHLPWGRAQFQNRSNDDVVLVPILAHHTRWRSLLCWNAGAWHKFAPLHPSLRATMGALIYVAESAVHVTLSQTKEYLHMPDVTNIRASISSGLRQGCCLWQRLSDQGMPSFSKAFVDGIHVH
jgi:Uncharacterized protein family UPF0016